MTVLVSAASKHGATAEIATAIGMTLERSGLEVDVRDIEDVPPKAKYDAYVVGSAVYMGHWLVPAKRFVEAHARELEGAPVWVFSSGPIADADEAASPQDSADGEELASTIGARGHELFGGKLDTSGLGVCERIAVRCVHAHDGDHRDWAAIEAWAERIAADLDRGAGVAALGSPGRVRGDPSNDA
jgi:menaquinone-dependent protoporphyrinogen oxidase